MHAARTKAPLADFRSLPPLFGGRPAGLRTTVTTAPSSSDSLGTARARTVHRMAAVDVVADGSALTRNDRGTITRISTKPAASFGRSRRSTCAPNQPCIAASAACVGGFRVGPGLADAGRSGTESGGSREWSQMWRRRAAGRSLPLAAAGMGWGSRGATFSSSPARPRSSRSTAPDSTQAACRSPTQRYAVCAIAFPAGHEPSFRPHPLHRR